MTAWLFVAGVVVGAAVAFVVLPTALVVWSLSNPFGVHG
jgi:hypothetical protein